MVRLLDKALKASVELPDHEHDEIARTILHLIPVTVNPNRLTRHTFWPFLRELDKRVVASFRLTTKSRLLSTTSIEDASAYTASDEQHCRSRRLSALARSTRREGACR